MKATLDDIRVSRRLSVQQAASVLQPLQTALRFSPSVDIYGLLVETWIHCEAIPADRDIENIAECVALFPRNTRLAYRSARLCAHSGCVTQAAQLIDQGLLFATDESTRKSFVRLRSALVAPDNK